MASALILGTVDGMALDRVTLDGSNLDYWTGAARPLVDGLVEGGNTPAEAFKRLTGWSNGYLVMDPA